MMPRFETDPEKLTLAPNNCRLIRSHRQFVQSLPSAKPQQLQLIHVSYIKPSLYIIDKSHVLVTNVTNVTVICPSSALKNVSCSKFCRVTIPCRCSLSSASDYIPARMTECIQGEVTLLHGVNLALLQNFFSESQLSNIWANSLLPDPMEIFLPDLKELAMRGV